MAKSKYTDIDLSKYDNGFQTTDAINQALVKKTNAENALANLGDFKFNYGNQEAYDKAMNDILNRKEFSYDLNGDVLYQQYKDNYINQGKMAMMDTMGQASAMTGGYGNSYAQSVGQQTYQGYLQGLNDKIPELYQMALDRYNAEGDRLATNYGLLSTDRQNAFNEYSTEYNTNLSRLTADRDYYTTDYNNIYNRDYTTWNDQRSYDTSQYWNEHNAGYTAEQDAIANQLARDQLNEQIRANKASEAVQWANYNARVQENKADAIEKAYENVKKSIVSTNKFFENAKVITHGARSNTGNGGYMYNGVVYKNYASYAASIIDNAYKNGEIDENTWNKLYDEYDEYGLAR